MSLNVNGYTPYFRGNETAKAAQGQQENTTVTNPVDNSNVAPDSADKEKSHAMEWVIGATALAAVTVLGILGHNGKLGNGVQKFLGGAEKDGGKLGKDVKEETKGADEIVNGSSANEPKTAEDLSGETNKGTSTSGEVGKGEQTAGENAANETGSTQNAEDIPPAQTQVEGQNQAGSTINPDQIPGTNVEFKNTMLPSGKKLRTRTDKATGIQERSLYNGEELLKTTTTTPNGGKTIVKYSKGKPIKKLLKTSNGNECTSKYFVYEGNIPILKKERIFVNGKLDSIIEHDGFKSCEKHFWENGNVKSESHIDPSDNLNPDLNYTIHYNEDGTITERKPNV